MKICRIMSKIYGIILWPIKILCRFILWLVKIICRIISKLGESANGEKQSNTSSLDYGEDEMCDFFHDEDWKKELSSAPNKMNDIKRELENMDSEKLKAFKLKTQTNLAKATLQNRNNIVEHGVPIVSIILSILAIILSIRPIEPITYSISGQKIEPKITGDNSNIFWAVVILVGLAIIIVAMFCYSSCWQRKHKCEIFYYQTMLNIVASIEEEREQSNHYDVSVRNTETGETKQFDTYLLPKNK